jgi:hypothetical protein
MTREEIEELMEELTHQFAATRDPEIREELYELARELATMEESNFEKPSELKRRVSPNKRRSRCYSETTHKCGIMAFLTGLLLGS